MLIALLIIGILILYYLQQFIFGRIWDKGLSLELKFGEDYIFEGKNGHLYETLVNNKFLPMIAVSVRIAVSRFLIFSGHSEANSGVSDMSYKRDIFTLMPRQQIRRTLTFKALKRGFYHIDSADLKAHDYLFIKSYFKTCDADTAIYVYPAQLDISSVRILNNALSGTLLTQNIINPDPFAFSSIRQYNRGDNIRFMNWKASGKVGQYMVNKYDSTTELSVMIYLDLQDDHIFKSEYLTEEAVRIAASLVSMCLDGMLRVQLVSNAGLIISSEGDHTNIHDWMRKISCVDPSVARRPIAETIKDHPAPSACASILISKNLNEENIKAFSSDKTNRGEALWICPHGLYDSAPAIDDKRISLLPWKVDPNKKTV